MSRMRRRVISIALILVVVAAMSFLVIISPLALRVIASNSNMNWPQLSNIGQTYGAVSALLSALALAGVAGSILMQNRELRHSRWEAGRSRHFDIIRMALDDPIYRQVFSNPGGGTPESEARLIGYINILFEYWAMMWEFGDWSEGQLRSHFSDVLGTKAGRSYWKMYGTGRSLIAGTKQERAFERIADEVYRDLERTVQNTIEDDKSHSRRFPFRRTVQSAGFSLGIIGACVAVLSWRQNRRRINLSNMHILIIKRVANLYDCPRCATH